MAKRQRNYKAEYARRTERAKREGFASYEHKRRIQIRAKVWTEKMAERLAEYVPDYFDDDTDLFDDSYFWEAFRNYYAKGTVA